MLYVPDLLHSTTFSGPAEIADFAIWANYSHLPDRVNIDLFGANAFLSLSYSNLAKFFVGRKSTIWSCFERASSRAGHGALGADAYPLFLPYRRPSRCTMTRARSAGVTPLMRLACARLAGRTRLSFSRASARNWP